MRDPDQVIKDWIGEHITGLIILAVCSMLIIGVIFVATESNKRWEAIPVVEREVFSNIIVDEYTECMFVIGDNRYTTHEYPCKYKMGELVKTKLTDSGRLEIID